MENDSKPTRLVPVKTDKPGEAPLHISGRSNPKGNTVNKEGPFTKISRGLSDLQRAIAALAGRTGSIQPGENKVVPAGTSTHTFSDRHTNHILENRSHVHDDRRDSRHERSPSTADRVERRGDVLVNAKEQKHGGSIRGAPQLGPKKTGSLSAQLHALSSGHRAMVAGSARNDTPYAMRGAVARPHNSESIRMPTISIPRTTSRQHVTGRGRGSTRGYQVVTGADAEAHRHVVEQVDHREPGALPSAARLAHILRTEELIRRGDAEPNELITSLAQAIRAGDRRPVADIEPAKVQQAIHASLGGETRASQLLNTPESTRLIERYQNTLAVIREGMHQTEQRIERSGTSAPNREGRTKLNSAQSVTPAARVQGSVTPPMPAPRVQMPNAAPTQDARTPVSATQALETMISTNEEPHAHMAGQASQIEMETSERESRSPARLPKMPQISSGTPKSVSMPGMDSAKPLGSTISAPVTPAAKISTTPLESKPARNGRMEISGKMTIIGGSGQVFGEGQFDGSLRGS